MKQGTLITKIVMFTLLIAVVLYLAIYAVQSLTDPFSTSLAYQDVLDDSAEITGVVVRKEQSLSGGSDIMDILPDEGERVAAGEAVAVLYQSQDTLDRKKQLQTLELELEQLEYALHNGGNLSDAAKLEQQIVSSLLTLRSNMAKGDLSSLESDMMILRAQTLQRDFAYSASGDSAAVLTQSIADLEQQISALKTQISASSSTVYAPRSGLFSGQSDGLESTLTPDALETITAGQLRSISVETSAPDSAGKLITGDRWYFAAVVDPSIADRLMVGDTAVVAFSRDYTGEFTMTVDRIGREEDGGCILVLSADRGLKNVTLLREQTVDLIFERYSGIRVPKQALRMETVTISNPDTGEETQSQAIGVYTVVGAQAEFKPVDIIREGSDYYLVASAKESAFFQTISTEEANLRTLRAGDEIIVTATGLYDGKVVLK